jgi:hypothetical protein
MRLVFFGVALAVLGAVFRLLFRPQLVWLEETGEGCRFWATGTGAKNLLKA